jgi:hypothetical protein
VRRLLVALSSLGLAVAGTQIAHAIAYRLAEPSAHERAHLLAETGHGYLRYTSLGFALVTAVVAVAFFSEIRGVVAGDSSSRPRLWGFAAIAPAMFCCQEYFERLLHDGAFPWTAALETPFLLGLALQLPFALIAYLLARLLLGAARAFAQLLAAPRVVAVRTPSRWPRLGLGAPRTHCSGLSLGPRAPPFVLVV